MPNIDIITSKLSAMSSYMEELSPYLAQVKIGKITVVSPEMHIIARLFQLIIPDFFPLTFSNNRMA